MVRYQVVSRSLFHGGDIIKDVTEGIKIATPLVTQGIEALKPIVGKILEVANSADKHLTPEQLAEIKRIDEEGERRNAIHKKNADEYDTRMTEGNKKAERAYQDYLTKHPEKAVKKPVSKYDLLKKDGLMPNPRRVVRRGGSLFNPYRVLLRPTSFGSGITNTIQDAKIREVMDLQNRTNNVIRPTSDSIRELIQADKKRKQDEKMKQVVNSKILTTQQDTQRIMDGARKSKELAVSQVKAMLNKNHSSITADIADITPETKTIRAKGLISDILRKGAKKKMNKLKGSGLQVF